MTSNLDPRVKDSLEPGVCTDSFSHETIFLFGCYDSILQWLQRTTDILSVLGFCVITFLKMCFAFILRYEIKEMIHKIRVLKGNSSATSATPLHELEAYLPRPSVQQESSFLINTPPGTGGATMIGSTFMPPDMARRRMTRTSGPFDNPLLSPPSGLVASSLTQHHRRHSSVTAITAAFQSGITSLSSAGRSSDGGGRGSLKDDKTVTSPNLSSSTATATTVVDINKSSGQSTSSTGTGSKRVIPSHDIITATKTALKSAAVSSSSSGSKKSVQKRSSDAEGSTTTAVVGKKTEPSMV